MTSKSVASKLISSTPSSIVLPYAEDQYKAKNMRTFRKSPLLNAIPGNLATKDLSPKDLIAQAKNPRESSLPCTAISNIQQAQQLSKQSGKGVIGFVRMSNQYQGYSSKKTPKVNARQQINLS